MESLTGPTEGPGGSPVGDPKEAPLVPCLRVWPYSQTSITTHASTDNDKGILVMTGVVASGILLNSYLVFVAQWRSLPELDVDPGAVHHTLK